jgi:histidine triad (HIT) family protein
MDNCIFCKILKGEIPSQKVYEDELVYAFRDINPAAPQHILIIPREHIESANALEEKHAELIGHIVLTAQKIAKMEGFADDGYRLVNNCGENAGQTVFHLHFDVLAGGKFDRMV